MALWRLEAVGDQVTLTYASAGEAPQRCGQTERVAESDLEAWVFEQAEPWDACEVTSGASFFRQASPAFGARA